MLIVVGNNSMKYIKVVISISFAFLQLGVWGQKIVKEFKSYPVVVDNAWELNFYSNNTYKYIHWSGFYGCSTIDSGKYIIDKNTIKLISIFDSIQSYKIILIDSDKSLCSDCFIKKGNQFVLSKAGFDPVIKYSNQSIFLYKGKIANKNKYDTLALYLRLRPPGKSYMRLSQTSVCYIQYESGTLYNFPDWISSLKYLEAIDLIGQYDFDLISNLPKISNPEKLEYLAISPRKLTLELMQVISQFKNLKQLHIKYELNENDKELIDKLQSELPNCKVGVSLFADYGDKYFSDKRK